MTTQPSPAGLDARDLTAQAEHQHPTDLVEVWGVDSFPASDPPANW